MSNIPLKLKNRQVVPPGGFRFYCHERGRWYGQTNDSLATGIAAKREFYRANGYPITQDFDRQFEQELCEALGPDWCIGFDPQQPIFYPSILDGSTLAQGAKTLGHWLAKSIEAGTFKQVSDQEVQRRAEVCCTGDGGNRCRFNDGPEHCHPCTSKGVKEILAGAIKGVSEALTRCPPTPYDGQLKACRVCACPLRSKICLPKEIILDHMPDSQKQMLPAWCWLK